MYQLRMLLAEKLIHLVLMIAPDGDEKAHLAAVLFQYVEQQIAVLGAGRS